MTEGRNTEYEHANQFFLGHSHRAMIIYVFLPCDFLRALIIELPW